MYKMSIILNLSSNSIFYTKLYGSIKEGFEQMGCTVYGSCRLPTSTELIEQVKKIKPDFVFEMNRVKSELDSFPFDIPHVCWVVDFWERDYSDFTKSDILYVWEYNSIKEFENCNIKNVKHLPPGTSKEYFFDKKINREYDFLFLGHITKHWTDLELARFVGYRDNKKVIFSQLLEDIKEGFLSQKYIKSNIDYLEQMGYIFKMDMEGSLFYDINTRTNRELLRIIHMDLFLKASENIAVYGSDNWKVYEKYKKLYKGFLAEPADMNQSLNQTKIMINANYTPHFRTFDAMASNTVVAVSSTPNEYVNEFEVIGLIENEDYITVDIYNSKIDKNIIHNIEKLQRISENAKAKVTKYHLWKHRAETILKDVINLEKGLKIEKVL